MNACAHCGGPRAAGARDYKGSEGGARIDRGAWIAHLEADPFCSAACCRAAHDLPEAGPEVSPGACSDCGKDLPGRRNRFAGSRCEACGEKDRKKRRYDTPGLCAGCGCDINDRTDRCGHCSGRFRKRERRLNDPVYRARVNAESRASKARTKALKSAACSPASQASVRAEQSVPGGGDLSTREAATAAEEAQAA